MYESFFALKEKPFVLTPNPRFLFLSKTHNEVYAHLIYGIENKVGFVEVTGEVGTGKTTVLRTLLAHLEEDKYRVAFIFNPKLTAFELLRNINREFGVTDDGESNPDLINNLNEFLVTENKEGRIPVLVIDEAQNLSGEVLEQIRLISNLETESEKLIQIVLVGQPELRHHLSDYSLRQLNQRIAVRYQLQTLNKEETVSYILHRLNIAGRPDGNLFSSRALETVFKYSGGVPRRINLVCDRALLTTYSEERSIVSVNDVKQAAGELAGLGDESNDPLPFAWKAVATLISLLVVVAGFLWLDPFEDDLSDASASVSKAPEQAVTPVVAAEPSVPDHPQDSLIAGSNALFRLWNAPLVPDDLPAEQFDFDREFGLRGFNLVRVAGSFEDFKKFNLPMLLPLAEGQGEEYLAVLAEDSNDTWIIAPDYNGKKALGASQLDQLGQGVAFVPWSDFASIGKVSIPGMRGENVRRLQFLLGLNGCPDIPANGRYGKQSIDCVKSFQRVNNLTVDGLVGPETLVLLYQSAGAYQMPLLN